MVQKAYGEIRSVKSEGIQDQYATVFKDNVTTAYFPQLGCFYSARFFW